VKRVPQANSKKRWIVCMGIIVLSLLLLGAGRVTEKLRERNSHKREEKQIWTEIVAGMSQELPLEHKKAWAKIAREKPKFLMEICTVNLSPLSSGRSN